jgi:hypothetical protein
MYFSRSFLLVIFQILILIGCSATNLQQFSLETPAQILNPVGMPPVKDGRARFREIFCKLLSEAPEYQDKAGNCENYLTRLSDERMPAEQLRKLPSNNINLRILIRPGLLGNASQILPFRLRQQWSIYVHWDTKSSRKWLAAVPAVTLTPNKSQKQRKIWFSTKKII